MNKTVNSLCVIVHGKNEQELRKMQLDQMALAVRNWSVQFEIVVVVDESEEVQQYGHRLAQTHPEIRFHACNYSMYANPAIKFALLHSIGILVFHADMQPQIDRLPEYAPPDDDQAIAALTDAGLTFGEYRLHRRRREKYHELHQAHLEIPIPYFAKHEVVRSVNN